MAARITPSGGVKSDKPWRDALMRALYRRAAGEGSPKRLEVVAERCVTKALAGDVTAIKEIADRLDGRPHQSVDTDVRGDVVLKWGGRD